MRRSGSMLIAVMLLSLVLSSAIPGAFGDYGLHFALAYVAIQVGRTAYTSWAKGEWQRRRFEEHDQGHDLLRRVGAVVDHRRARQRSAAAPRLVVRGARRRIFRAAVLLLRPGLGRSTVEEWDISGAHMAERCSLFIIISLGEGILVTGATFADLEPSLPAILAFLSAFVASVAMWWIYFDVGARRGSELIEQEEHAGPDRPSGLHLRPYPDRRGHHRARRRGRAGAGASDRPQRALPARDHPRRQRSSSSAATCSSSG